MSDKLFTFLSHLGRGGKYQYWFALPERHTTWWSVNLPAPMQSTLRRDLYFSVNPTNTQSTERQRAKAATVAAVNTLWADYDAKDFGDDLGRTMAAIESLPIQPSVIVCSGGGYHCYWLLEEPVIIDDDNREAVARTLKDWAAYCHSDSAASDLPRVLRVPGSLNHKYQPPRDVAFVRCDMTMLYSWTRLQRLCLPAESAPGAPQTAPQPAPYMPTYTSGVDEYSRAEAALALLGVNRADDYSDWIRVGMALRAGLGSAGLSLWESWSRRSPKYRDGECERKWHSFENVSLGFGTLIAMARQDDPMAFDSSPVLRPSLLKKRDNFASQVAQQPARHIEELVTKPAPRGIRLSDLQTKDLAPLVWVVDGLLPEGVTLLAAKPKTKKSWLALNVALSVAMNGRALGQLPVVSGDVLYLDLEGNQRRIKNRVASILGNAGDVDWPSNVDVYTEWERGIEAIEALTRYRAENTGLRLVVVDLLAEVRPPMDPRQPTYDYDRQFLRALNGWGEEHHVAVLVIHHVRKSKGEDVFDEISGTLGINGAVSTMLILARDASGQILLHRTGRDMIDDDALTLTWDHQITGFVISTDNKDPGMSDSRHLVLEAMTEEMMKPSEIAERAELTLNAVNKQLRKLLQQGLVQKAGYGVYSLSKEGHSRQSGKSRHSRQSGQSFHSATPLSDQAELQTASGRGETANSVHSAYSATLSKGMEQSSESEPEMQISRRVDAGTTWYEVRYNGQLVSVGETESKALSMAHRAVSFMKQMKAAK
jgi:hypothetical protein